MFPARGIKGVYVLQLEGLKMYTRGKSVFQTDYSYLEGFLKNVILCQRSPVDGLKLFHMRSPLSPSREIIERHY